ncbi:MAG: hypothetical protein ACOCWQ_06220 [Nanoarchaeota archaeon]
MARLVVEPTGAGCPDRKEYKNLLARIRDAARDIPEVDSVWADGSPRGRTFVTVVPGDRKDAAEVRAQYEESLAAVAHPESWYGGLGSEIHVTVAEVPTEGLRRLGHCLYRRPEQKAYRVA